MIRNMLELSTAHIPNGIRHCRNSVRGRLRTLRMTEHDYGFVVFVSACWSITDHGNEWSCTGEDLREALEGVAGWLVPIYTHAIKHGCGIINFDADGPIVEEFKTYE